MKCWHVQAGPLEVQDGEGNHGQIHSKLLGLPAWAPGALSLSASFKSQRPLAKESKSCFDETYVVPYKAEPGRAHSESAVTTQHYWPTGIETAWEIGLSSARVCLSVVHLPFSPPPAPVLSRPTSTIRSYYLQSALSTVIGARWLREPATTKRAWVPTWSESIAGPRTASQARLEEPELGLQLRRLKSACLLLSKGLLL